MCVGTGGTRAVFARRAGSSSVGGDELECVRITSLVAPMSLELHLNHAKALIVRY